MRPASFIGPHQVHTAELLSSIFRKRLAPPAARSGVS